MDSNIKNCPHFWQLDLAGGNNIYCSNCGLSKTLTALIIKARADERQAMLDALPERKLEMSDAMWDIPDTLEGKFQRMGLVENKGFNECRDQMETAIKKIGGRDE